MIEGWRTRTPGRGLWLVAGATLVLWASISLPLALGRRTLFFRDVFSNHLPVKAFGSTELRRGRIPALNPVQGLGQPYRGNPSSLAFYPGNLLYLVLPFWSAFNLHYALHWLLAMLTMWALARELGLSREGALLAALTYGGSGWLLSTLSFYNLLTVAAWWPLALWGSLRGGRRGIAVGGLALGLALLGGEPVTAALGLIPLVTVAIARHGAKKGLGVSLWLGSLGLLVALPQVVATARILPFSLRGGPGVAPGQAAGFSLHPLRLIELLVPLPFGWPGHLGRSGFWAVGIAPSLPYFFSLYFGIVGLWLAATVLRRHRLWTTLAAAGLLLSWATGLFGEGLRQVSGGLFRYPEKFLFWFALATPLLAGWGLQRIKAEPPERRRGLAVCGGIAFALALLLRLATPALVRSVAGGPPPGGEPSLARVASIAEMQLERAAWALFLGAILLLVSVWAAQRRRLALLLAVQLASLLQLAPLVGTDSTVPYRKAAPWVQKLEPGTGVVNSAMASPPWHAPPSYGFEDGSRAQAERLAALDLDPVPGVLFGLRYPLRVDPEGMHSPLTALLLDTLPKLTWRGRWNWFRTHGVEAAVLYEEPGEPFRSVEQVERRGVPTRLVAVPSPAPPAWWPKAVTAAASPVEALRHVTEGVDPIANVVASRIVEHHAGGQVSLTAEAPDRIELETESDGGLVVLQRAYHPLFAARSEDGRLPTLAVNLDLLGVIVPPGRHTVIVEVSSLPETIAGTVALAALLGGVAITFGKSREKRRAGSEGEAEPDGSNPDT